MWPYYKPAEFAPNDPLDQGVVNGPRDRYVSEWAVNLRPSVPTPTMTEALNSRPAAVTIGTECCCLRQHNDAESASARFWEPSVFVDAVLAQPDPSWLGQSLWRDAGNQHHLYCKLDHEEIPIPAPG
jgi:hypothetical protein